MAPLLNHFLYTRGDKPSKDENLPVSYDHHLIGLDYLLFEEFDELQVLLL